MIVEDEPRLAENIARSLRESAGYAVDVATDGQEGLFLAESGLRRKLDKGSDRQLIHTVRGQGYILQD